MTHEFQPQYRIPLQFHVLSFEGPDAYARAGGLDVEALVIPNGLSADTFAPPAADAVAAFRHRCRDRTVVAKVARWDPDKRWLLTIDTMAAMKHQGWNPLFLARGGVEAHGVEVLQAAKAAGLRVAERSASQPGLQGLLQTLAEVHDVDMVSLLTPIDTGSRRVLFRGADAVLANSGHEPFGLVGLETMAAGGVACTGCSGEDYAMPGRNALVLETHDPWEFVGLFGDLRAHPDRERSLRQNGERTARDYAWPRLIHQVLLPRIRLSTRYLHAFEAVQESMAIDDDSRERLWMNTIER
jgi:glycosyltransferase involved in cell wall biosynthesis